MPAASKALVRARIAMVAAFLALAISVTGLSPAEAVRRVSRVAFAKNAGAVDGLSASRKPKPGQLLSLDRSGKFPAGALPLASLPRGPRGPEGPAGGAGARGPSDAYVDVHAAGQSLSTQANAITTAARLADLPAGNYVLSASVQTGDFTNGGEIVSCDIRANGESLGGSSVVIGTSAGSTRLSVISVVVPATTAAPFVATLDCWADQSLATPPGVANARLAAVRVENLRTSKS